MVVATYAALAVSALAAGSMKVDNLRCEYKSNPMGLDVAKPRLS
jgi:hypothetical protein